LIIFTFCSLVFSLGLSTENEGQLKNFAHFCTLISSLTLTTIDNALKAETIGILACFTKKISNSDLLVVLQILSIDIK